MKTQSRWESGIAPLDAHNQRLIDHVHPAGWKNPVPEGRYNLIAIGGGSAGLISAIGTAGLGGKVALIERHLMGGDCLNVGCVPSKSLIRPARLAAQMREAAAFGLRAPSVDPVDFAAVMERVRRIRADISQNDSVQRYTDQGVDVFLGEARFTSPGTIEVGGQELRFQKAVIATGARAVAPDIPGLEEAGYLTNETVFNLTELPSHLVVLGGGPIGCELAQAFRRLGSRVTMVVRSRLLSREAPSAAALLSEVFKHEGIEVLLEAEVTGVELQGGAKVLQITHAEGARRCEADQILVGVGRAPNVEGLGLEQAGIGYDLRSGIEVDDFLRTRNRDVYAAGDCCMQHKFTHAADAAAQIVIQNALFGGRKRLSALTMPWCTYTDPEIAHVGLYEHEAAAQGVAVDAYRFEMAENDRAQADGETAGFVTVVVGKGGDRILGATVVAAHAGEMINELSVAMAAGMGLGRLGRVIHPYPTQSEAIKRVAGLYNKTRLTPTVARLMEGWLRMQRR
jgi:pyruvate/2-oxoglutarate dehydrogenase complex dihydrolipoamide dehydrogenase (E3) component